MEGVRKAMTEKVETDSAIQVALCLFDGDQVILVRSQSLPVVVLDPREHQAMEENQMVLLRKLPDPKPKLRHRVVRVEGLQVSQIGLRQNLQDLLASFKLQQSDFGRRLEKFRQAQGRDDADLRSLQASLEGQLATMRAEAGRTQQQLRNQQSGIDSLLQQLQEAEADHRQVMQALARSVRSALNEVPNKFTDAQAAQARLDVHLRSILDDFNVEGDLREAVEAVLDEHLAAVRMKRIRGAGAGRYMSTITDSEV